MDGEELFRGLADAVVAAAKWVFSRAWGLRVWLAIPALVIAAVALAVSLLVVTLAIDDVIGDTEPSGGTTRRNAKFVKNDLETGKAVR